MTLCDALVSLATEAPASEAPRRDPEAIRLRDWAEGRATGTYPYWRGHLGHAVPKPAVACLAAELEERGRVHLLQRRHGPDDYTYLAIKPRGGKL